MLPTNKPASIESRLMNQFGLPYKQCLLIVAEASTKVGPSASDKQLQDKCRRLVELRHKNRRGQGSRSGRIVQTEKHSSTRTASTADTTVTMGSSSWPIRDGYGSSKTVIGDNFGTSKLQIDAKCSYESMTIVGIAKEPLETEATSTTEGCYSEDILITKPAKIVTDRSPKSRKQTAQHRRDADIPSNIYLLHEKPATTPRGVLQRLKTSYPSPVHMKAGDVDDDWQEHALVTL